MPVEVIGSMYGAAALLLLAAGYFFAGGTPALVGAGEGYRDDKRKGRPAWADTLMFFGGGGGDDGSDEIRRQEEARQRRIRQSTERINRIFDQFKGIEYRPADVVRGKSREEYAQAIRAALDGNVTNTPGSRRWVDRIGASDDSGDQGSWVTTPAVSTINSAGRAALRELGFSDDQITSGSYSHYMGLYDRMRNDPSTYQKFDTGDSLYDQYRQDYLSYYRPQLKDQYQDAQQDVMFDLARRGATESSAGQQRLSDLLEAYNKQQTLMQNQATNAVNDYRGSIEQQRQALISQAQAGMAPTDAANLASNAFNQLKAQTPEYSALGDVFSQFADVYGMGLRAQGAGFGGFNPTSGGAAGLPGRSGTAKIRS